MNHTCPEHHQIQSGHEKLKKNEQKTLVVIIITFVMMVVEIVMGNITGSMALTADGWHMASHAGALSISYLAYRLHRSEKIRHQFSFGPGKLLPLGGYTSAVCLGLVAFFMGYESILRLIHPVDIRYGEAIIVAVVGLVINGICAFILKDDHTHGHAQACNHSHSNKLSPLNQQTVHKHDHDSHHDHNLNSAYMHVLADALTSVLAIIALLLGKYFNLNWMDPLMGIVGGIVILKWAIGLCKETAFELLDGHDKSITHQQIKDLFTEDADVVDLHIWKIAPGALACELVINSKTLKGTNYYRHQLNQKFAFKHLIIEERQG